MMNKSKFAVNLLAIATALVLAASAGCQTQLGSPEAQNKVTKTDRSNDLKQPQVAPSDEVPTNSPSILPTVTIEKELMVVFADFDCPPCDQLKRSLIQSGIPFGMVKAEFARSLGVTVRHYPTAFILEQSILDDGEKKNVVRSHVVLVQTNASMEQLKTMLTENRQ